MLKHILVVLFLASAAIAQGKKPIPPSPQEFFGKLPIVAVTDSATVARFPAAKVYTDEGGRGAQIIALKVLQQGRILIFEDGTPYANMAAILFNNLTEAELRLILAKIELYESEKAEQADRKR